MPIGNVLAGDDGNLAAWIQLGFESSHAELTPIDVVLGQLRAGWSARAASSASSPSRSACR